MFGRFGEAAMPAVLPILRDEYGRSVVCGLEPRFGVLRVAEGVGEESAGELAEGDSWLADIRSMCIVSASQAWEPGIGCAASVERSDDNRRRKEGAGGE